MTAFKDSGLLQRAGRVLLRRGDAAAPVQKRRARPADKMRRKPEDK